MLWIFPWLGEVLILLVVFLERWGFDRTHATVLAHMLEDPRHHYLLLLLSDVFHTTHRRLLWARDILTMNIVHRLVLLWLYESIRLQNLVNPLLDHPHVNEHVALSDTLVAQKVLINFIITLHDFRYLLDASFNLFYLLDVLVLIFLHQIYLCFDKRQLFLKVFDQPVLLRVKTAFLQVPIYFTLHLQNLGLVILDL